MAKEKMLELARQTMENAYNPYSKFSVGACVLGDDGNYYAGCNIENVSYRVTMCAEQVAIGQMIAAGAKKIKEMVIVTGSDMIISPCGACRQVILEFADPNTQIHMYNNTDKSNTMTVADLIPAAFDSEFLD
jgi:cytidine deaminase